MVDSEDRTFRQTAIKLLFTLLIVGTAWWGMALLILGAAALAPALAQGPNAGRTTEGLTSPAPAFDQTAARIKYLHDRLRITEEQESLWEPVAQAIRESAEALAPLRREQFRAATSGTALDLLHSYEMLGDTQLDDLKKIIAAFDPLYAGLPDNQKKIADAILREGAQNAMIGGIPFVPPPFTPALAYPLLWGGLGAPLLLHRPLGFHHFAFHPVGFHHFGRFHH